MSNKESRKVSKIVIILSLVIAALSIYILLENDLSDKPLAGQGSAIEGQAMIGGEFELTDQDGNKFTSEQMKGKISLVYFGFTFCPDICPTSLHKLNKVITTLGKYNIEILPIFITVDPSRDKSSMLKEYLAHFNAKMIGLSGTEAEIKRVADLYKVYYAVADSHDKNDDKYMLDHSSFVYLMGRDGKYVKHFYMSNTAEEIIEYIRINHKSL
ncbi:MAG: hypothetical protein DGJ47_000487 [Rickettsiaceae bacterium]